MTSSRDNDVLALLHRGNVSKYMQVVSDNHNICALLHKEIMLI